MQISSIGTFAAQTIWAIDFFHRKMSNWSRCDFLLFLTVVLSALCFFSVSSKFEPFHVPPLNQLASSQIKINYETICNFTPHTMVSMHWRRLLLCRCFCYLFSAYYSYPISTVSGIRICFSLALLMSGTTTGKHRPLSLSRRYTIVSMVFDALLFRCFDVAKMSSDINEGAVRCDAWGGGARAC